MMKKFVCVLLSSFLLFNSFSLVNVFADESVPAEEKYAFIDDLIGATEETTAYTDERLGENIDVLKSVYPEIKIYEDLKSEVSRADFLTMLVQLTAEGRYPSYTDFNDVDDESSMLQEYLGYAVEMGLVSKGTSFRPDDSITYHEMLKMAVVACGYEVAAQNKGGWPTGYVGVAGQIGLLNYLKTASGVVSAEDVYRLLYNVITVDLMEQTTYGPNGSFEINKDSSILANRFGVKVFEGVFYANQLTSLTRVLDEKEPTITIGTHKFPSKTKTELLGYNVRAFLIDNNGQDEVISIRKYRNKEVFVSDFSGLEGYTLKAELPGGGTKEYKLYKGYSLLLNDIASPDTKLEDYTNRDDVTLRLIDNNQDGVFDVVKLYVWQYMQVEKVSTVAMTISGKEVTRKNLDLSKENSVFKIYDCTAGNLTEIELEDLAANDILTYVISDNMKWSLIFRSKVEISGIYNARDSVGHIITVDENDYELSVYAREHYPYLLFGENVKLKLDATGLVVSVEQSDSAYSYAWIVESYIDRQNGKKEVSVEIFSQDGLMKIYPVAKKVYIDDIRSSAEDFYEIEQELVDDRLVKFGLNSSGEINMIDFPSTYDGVLPFAESMPKRNSFTEYYSGRYQKSGNGTFGTAFINKSDTICFSVPINDRENEDLYRIKTINSLRNTTFDIKAYDMAPGEGPNVVLTFSDDAVPALDSYSAIHVVIDKRYALNEDDISTLQIQTYDGTNYHKYFVDEDVDVSEVSPGDLVRIATYKDRICLLTVDYSLAKNEVSSTATSGKNAFYKGYVYAYGSRMIQLWDTINLTANVSINSIYGLDFRDQKVTFVDVYKKSDGSIREVMPRYMPISVIKDYLHSGTDADYMIACMQDNSYHGKWIYRVIED